MLTITLENAGKKYNKDWIFRQLNHTFTLGEKYAITGNNGSGKSTLLQSIAGIIELKQGSCIWQIEQRKLPLEKAFQYFSFVAPYLDIIEEMTAKEFLQLHHAFKPYIPSFSIKDILTVVGLEKAANKQIRYYSSGMKQRVKLAQAIFTDTPVLFLDEPCSNLDAEGQQLYLDLIQQYCQKKLIIISSNDPNEYNYCSTIIDIRQYK